MKEISLTQGYIAFVDEEDYERIAAYKWFAVVTVTGPSTIHVAACRWTPGSYPNRKMLYMHYEVLQMSPSDLTPLGKLIDHINRTATDNQKHNLRVANKSINGFNSIRSINGKGVYFEKSRNRYKAFHLLPNRGRAYIGTFKTEAEAIEARRAYLASHN